VPPRGSDRYLSVLAAFLFLAAAARGRAQTVTATVSVGSDPAAIAVNPVTNKVYVADGVETSTVTEIDGATNATTTLAAGANPFSIAVDPVTNRVYVGDGADANVTVIDGATNAATTVPIAGNIADAIAVNSATNTIYVANISEDNVTVIDGATHAIGTVPAGHGPDAVAVNPVTGKVYAVNFLDGTVTVIDGTTNATATVPVGRSPGFVAANPATNQIYIANFGDGTVTVIDGATNATATVAVGGDPAAIAVNPVTDRIYVANAFDNTVTVIDGGTNATATVAVGANPRSLAVNPVTNTVYVANESGRSVTAIDGATNAPVTLAAGSGPDAVAVNPVTNTIYVGNANDGTVTVMAGPLVTPLPPPRLINISTRAHVGNGGNILIPGFVVSGSGVETLLIRADGPALGAFGVGGALAQPSLSVFDSSDTVVASNTGWGTNSNSAQIANAAAQVGAFALAQGSADCALIARLPPGAYTVQVSGVDNSTGIALAEVYEVSSTGTRLVNLSTRAQVGTGADIVIPGFVIAGAGSEQLLARADGPALTAFGISGALAQPTFSVFDDAGNVIASNTGWGTGSNPTEIAKAGASVGAFALVAGSADSAQIVSLPAGAYTMKVSGVGNSTGIGLAEVYEVP
jgi:YVTN family beta-propeller protein